MGKRKQYPGVYIFWAIALLVVPIWWLSYPETTIRHNVKPFFVYVSQVTALVGFSFFALSFVLSVRLRVLEDLFGGLDKVYRAHHDMGKVALLGMVVHPLMLALRWIPENMPKVFWYLFPVHRRMEINIGSWVMWGVVVLLFFTLVVKIPYHRWKQTHKLLGLFFIAAVIHILWTDPTLYGNVVLKGYILLLGAVAILSWVYKTFLFDFVKKRFDYRVTQIRRLNERVMEIELAPIGERLSFVPGQFCFFSFESPHVSKEAHPFTITQSGENGQILIMVKALGDYTDTLFETLKVGTLGKIEGPYGRFDYRSGATNQVWIGGGVGIAPFISWANELIFRPSDDLKVDIYYCVNDASEATHLSVFHTLQEIMPSAKVHLICSDAEGFVRFAEMENITRREIFICGPRAMRKALLSESKQLHIPKGNIHFEDFDFV